MTDANTSTRTPTSTGLLRVFSPRVCASVLSHSAPLRPGATITYFASSFSPFSVCMPSILSPLIIRLLTSTLVCMSTLSLRCLRMLRSTWAHWSVPMWRIFWWISLSPAKAAFRSIVSIVSWSVP